MYIFNVLGQNHTNQNVNFCNISSQKLGNLKIITYFNKYKTYNIRRRKICYHKKLAQIYPKNSL